MLTTTPPRPTADDTMREDFDRALHDLLRQFERHRHLRGTTDIGRLSESRRVLDTARRRAARLGRRLGAPPVERIRT